MKKGVSEGYVLPKALVKKNNRTYHRKAFILLPIAALPDSFSDTDKKELIQRYTRMIAENIIPVYQKMHDYLVGDYMKAARTTTGISEIPNGSG
jgi:uncharacterized protein (DUF885 family)